MIPKRVRTLWMRRLREFVGCVICGGDASEFDHIAQATKDVSSDKQTNHSNVATVVRDRTLHRVYMEISICQPKCRRCHAPKTDAEKIYKIYFSDDSD